MMVFCIGLGWVSDLCGQEAEWKKTTVLVSRNENQTVVKPLINDQILFESGDPQLAIEWAMQNALNTVIMGGRYSAHDRIDIPRNNVTLIISRDAEVSLNGDMKHTSVLPGFRGRDGTLHPHPAVIHNKGHDHVRVVNLGTIIDLGAIFFDGRNSEGTCGIEGGLVLAAGQYNQQPVQLNDCRGVTVPLALTDKTLSSVVGLEGCDSCRIGTVIHLAGQPDGKTGEGVDLNASNRNIHVDRLIAERPHEIIDMNGSHLDAKEVICIGEPDKLLCFTVNAGPRWTSRPPTADRLDVWKTSILEEAQTAKMQVTSPALPESLPKFTVAATVEVMMKDGTQKIFTKEVEFDLRRE